MSEPALTFFGDDDPTWPAQGHWTYEDYLRLPDDGRRYEVVRGVLYVSPSPRYGHQYAISMLFRTLGSFVFDDKLGVVLTAPFEVLMGEIATPVQPDLIFLRAGREPRAGDASFQGAPDLVVEVLSPSNQRYDRKIKLEAYQDAGIQEYWLVDPMARTVVIQALGRNGRYAEFARGGEEEMVRSRVLEGFSLRVADLFPPVE